MARTLTTSITCDFCELSSEYLPSSSFVSRGSDDDPVDLCRWCAHPGVAPGAQMSSAGHTVTFTDTGWTCSCGTHFQDRGWMTLDVWPFLVLPRVRAQVSIPIATAQRHTEVHPRNAAPPTSGLRVEESRRSTGRWPA
ncbi:MAG: hypothetical protein VX494_14680 [Actinomycetota bacterium]|nr:hypothetical protein [Actinomycetota bacterium]MEE3128450.1 hypothetical protein [Actinomycetota bacterium]